MKLALDAEVHYYRSRRSVIGIKHAGAGWKKQFVPVAQPLSTVQHRPDWAAAGPEATLPEIAPEAPAMPAERFRSMGSFPAVPQTEVGVPELGMMVPVEVLREMPRRGRARRGSCRNAPVASRNGPSKSTLFQMAFSQNKPIPPRIAVLPSSSDPTQNPGPGQSFVGLVDRIA